MSALLGAKGPGVIGHLMGLAFEKGQGKQEPPGFSNTARPPKPKKRKKVTTALEPLGG